MDLRITYETLFDILRKEKSKDDLQVLPPEFYKMVKDFLEVKPSGSRLANIEYENAKKIMKELYERRERKVMTLALNKSRTDSIIIPPGLLLPEEEVLLNRLLSALKESKSGVLTPLLNILPTKEAGSLDESIKNNQNAGQNPHTLPSTGDSYVLRVIFEDKVPKFMGPGMKVYGPFEPGDESELPKKIAEILINKGKARFSSS